MNTTPQERLALGVMALLVSAGVGARMLHRAPAAAELAGPGTEAEAGALQALRGETEHRAKDAAARARPLASGERIDPNAATEEELDRLPRVGPGQARKIVAWRQAHGPFRTLADLDSVPGVGASLLAAVAPHLTLAPAPAEPAPRVETATSPPRAGPVSAPAVADAGAVVDLNRASAEELRTLPGIGPALAARVIAWRTEHGRFRSVDELERVPGIGGKTATRLRPRVRASP
ncbi:MAG TPA: helix-hairpin-helix domain-containing protein [Longimicrobium sp.]|nr:helix-hairpin-helix domain-containing protein [Longimicrobium sp.]